MDQTSQDVLDVGLPPLGYIVPPKILSNASRQDVYAFLIAYYKAYFYNGGSLGFFTANQVLQELELIAGCPHRDVMALGITEKSVPAIPVSSKPVTKKRKQREALSSSSSSSSSASSSLSSFPLSAVSKQSLPKQLPLVSAQKSILLFGMVFACEVKAGAQEFRDKLRLEELQRMGYDCWSYDEKQPSRGSSPR